MVRHQQLELFIYYVDGDGNGGWLPSSPLGARVEAGEAAAAGSWSVRLMPWRHRDPDDYLKKTGDTFTGGALGFKRTDESSYWSYITFDTPEAWKTAENTHGVIINIGQTNSYKQQLKIQGRSGSELFKLLMTTKL